MKNSLPFRRLRSEIEIRRVGRRYAASPCPFILNIDYHVHRIRFESLRVAAPFYIEDVAQILNGEQVNIQYQNLSQAIFHNSQSGSQNVPYKDKRGMKRIIGIIIYTDYYLIAYTQSDEMCKKRCIMSSNGTERVSKNMQVKSW